MPGVGISAFIPDALHTMHLGVYQRAFGSVLKYLTHFKLPHGTDENVSVVWTELKAKYEAFDVNRRFGGGGG